MTSKELTMYELCNRSRKFFAFQQKKNKTFYTNSVVKNILANHCLDYTTKDILEELKNIPDSVFFTKREYEKNTELVTERLLRYQRTARIGGRYEKGRTVSITSIPVTVHYDYAVVQGDDVVIVRVKNKKNMELKWSGKSIATRVSMNMDLFLLQLAGEKVYPNHNVIACVDYLAITKDKATHFCDDDVYIESQRNESRICYQFADQERDEMEVRLDDLVQGKCCDRKTSCSNCKWEPTCLYVQDQTKLVVIPPKPKSKGAVTFTSQQEELIQSMEGNYRVIAGAGSGKTTVVANRICNLIKKGVPVKEILLITFTNKGCEEMKEKVMYWAKEQKLPVSENELNIYTFNSFGQKMIETLYLDLGFTDKPKLIERSESLDIIKAILDDFPDVSGLDYLNPTLNTRHAKGSVFMVSDYFDKINVSECVYPEEVVDLLQVGYQEATMILQMYKEYKSALKANNQVDFTDQVRFCFEIFQLEKNLWKYGFQYLIVDEFQDSDNIQINILKELESAPDYKGIMVVGDDSQAIYAFRGATSENILRFHHVFDNVVDIKLEQNFRSTEEICRLANYINNQNMHKIPKKLFSTKHGKLPMVNNNDLVEQIMERLQNGAKPSEIAVLSRNKTQLLELQSELIRHNIPSVLSVPELFINNQTIRILIDFMKFLQDTDDDAYFVGYQKLKDYTKFIQMEQKSDEEFYDYILEEKKKFLLDYLAIDDEGKFSYILEDWKKIAALSNDRAIPSLLSKLEEKGIISMKDLFYFFYCMDVYSADYVIEKIEEPLEAITLTTMHSSKGREWEYVFLDCSKLKFHPIKAITQTVYREENEEERRLFFVAVTRAKEELTLYKCGSFLENELLIPFNGLTFISDKTKKTP